MDVSRCPLGVGRDAGASASAPDGLATRAGDTNEREDDSQGGQSPAEVLFHHESPAPVPKVTVVVPLHNYEQYIVECLESVRLQTTVYLDLIVADDCSRDQSAERVIGWMRTHARRFRRCQLLRNTVNLRLSRTRNRLFEHARTEYIFALDADNTIYPRCLESLASALDHCDADFAYCCLEKFGVERGLVSWRPWDPEALLEGPYIDAMAMVRKSTWERVGGYSADMPSGLGRFRILAEDRGGKGLGDPRPRDPGAISRSLEFHAPYGNQSPPVADLAMPEAQASRDPTTR